MLTDLGQRLADTPPTTRKLFLLLERSSNIWRTFSSVLFIFFLFSFSWAGQTWPRQYFPKPRVPGAPTCSDLSKHHWVATVCRHREPCLACAPPSRECMLPGAPQATTHLPWSVLGRLCWGPGRTYHFPTLTFKRLLTAHAYLTLSAVPWASYLYL